MKVIVAGKAKGKVLKSNIPINFLGTVNKKTGMIHDSKHDLHDIPMKDTILVFPNGIGSSVGAYTIYSIKSHNTAPVAMICKKVDLTVASGCALANIPLVIASEQEYEKLQSGQDLTLDTDSGVL